MAKLGDGNGKMRLCLMDTQRDLSFLLRHLRDDPAVTETLREVMRDVDVLDGAHHVPVRQDQLPDGRDRRLHQHQPEQDHQDLLGGRRRSCCRRP
ncbi:MAG: hypothetical protein MZV65_22015 [Chromatiales bacterium]|nr:hypothetical protein [Chromatiales bacterium]